MDADDPGTTSADATNLLSEPLRNWWEYSNSTEDIVHLTHEAFGQVTQTPKLYELLEAPEDDVQRARWKAERAQKEIDAGFSTVHAHSLLGLWGAFECLIEDLFIAAINDDPSLLAEEAFAKVKIPVPVMYGLNEDDRSRMVLQETSRSLNVELAQGVSRFERLLELVHLDGPIPRRVRQAVFEANHIRNVWAHRAGIADVRFVDNCPHLGYAVGDKVEMNSAMFMPFMHAFHMYVVVLTNRQRIADGKAPIDVECEGYEGCLREIEQITDVVD